MAVGQLVALAKTTTSNVANTVTATIPNDGSVVVGDLLIWTAGLASGSRTFTVSGVSNYSFAGSASQSGSGIHLWYKICEAGDLGATITLTPSTGATTMAMMLGKVSGVDQTNPFDSPVKIASNNSTAATTKTTPTVTSVAAGSREISIVFDTRGSQSQTTSWTAPAGETKRDSAFAPSPDNNPRVSMAWGDSDAEVSGSVGGRVWTADVSSLGESFTLAVKVGVTNINDSDTATGSDSQTISATSSDTEVGAGADTESVAATSTDTDTGTGAETTGISLTDTDSAAGNETQSVTATAPTTPSDTEGGSSGESWYIQIFNAPVAERSLVLGPATLYIAPYGATEPSLGSTSTAPDAGTWTDLGGLLGGVELLVEQEWEEIQIQQKPDTPARRLKRRRLKIKIQMAEATLANLGYALNDTAGVSGVTYTPSSFDPATQLTYMALIVDGWAPGFKINRKHKRRRVVVRKCLSMDNVETGYTKDGQTVFTVTWACHYVNGSTPPFRIVDEQE